MSIKIAILSSEFPPLPGGIGNHAYHLSKYLQKAGFKIAVLTDVRQPIQDLAFDNAQPFSIYRVKRNRLTQVNRIWKAIQLTKKHNVIICSGKFSLWVGGFLQLFFKKRFLAVLHGSELKAGGSLSQTLTKWSLRQFDSLIAVSMFTKNYALAIDPSLIVEVIPNGIELERFIERNTKKTASLNLVTVGNVTFRKGQQNVIKVLPVLLEKYPQIHYHCIGIPTEKEAFTALAVSLGVLHAITFHGIISDTERNKILKKSTLFLMLSEHVGADFEGFGIALLEANALGIPAIGSNDSGITDAINYGYSGFLVNQHQSSEIEAAISKILKDYDHFSSQARKWSQRFDWNMIVTSYIKIIQDEA